MQRFKFLLVYILCLFLFGCSFAPQKSAKQAVLTKYESVVPQEVKDLDIYKKALKQNSVIVYNGTAITDVQTVKDFLSDIENKEDAELHCYEFSNVVKGNGKVDKRIVYQKVYSENNKIMLQTQYSDDCINGSPNWNELNEKIDTEEIKKINMNDYGMLYYPSKESNIDYDIVIVPVLNYDEIPYYKISEQKAIQLDEKYIDPLGYDLLFGFTFDDAYDIENWVDMFDDLYLHKNSDFYDVHTGEISMNDFMALINQYFDIDKQTVINTFHTFNTVEKDYDEEGNMDFCETYYDENTDRLVLRNEGRGGAGADMEITDYKEENSILTIYYHSCNIRTKVPRKNYELKVKLMDDGTFRYISCIQVD